MKDLLAGLDIGTSAVKACLYDLQGRQLAAALAEQPISNPYPGWAEQNPADWWHGVQVTMHSILDGIDRNRIIALGLSGQCPGHVMVDKQGNALGPAIIWRDHRAMQEAQWISERIASNAAFAWSGISQNADATLPPARLRWLQSHRHEEWDQAVAILQPKDFIGLCLTGEMATDLYSAYSFVDPAVGSYDEDYFAALQLPLEKMPKVLAPTSCLGNVTQSAAARTGLSPNTPVVSGTIDAWCDNIACGASLWGRAVDIAGTSEIISLGVPQAEEGFGVFLAELSPQDKFICGPTQFGGSTLRWLVDIFYPEMGKNINFRELENTASWAPPASDGLIFMPYLCGERAPIWDAQARGGFVGITMNHTRSHFTRAVYEAVSYAVRHVLEYCQAAAKIKADCLIICGGGSRSHFWNQLKANVLQIPVYPMKDKITACLGAAILAGISMGCFSDIRQANQIMTQLGDLIEPDDALSPCYEDGYQRYKRLYPALRPLFQNEIQEKK